MCFSSVVAIFAASSPGCHVVLNDATRSPTTTPNKALFKFVRNTRGKLGSDGAVEQHSLVIRAFF